MLKKELLFSVDAFNKPKEDHSPEALLVSTLLFKKPGSSPVHPDAGFYIQRYKFKELEDNIITIQNDFKAHCEKYLPEIYIDEIKIQKADDNTIVMGISILSELKREEFITFRFKEEKGKLLSELIS